MEEIDEGLSELVEYFDEENVRKMLPVFITGQKMGRAKIRNLSTVD